MLAVFTGRACGSTKDVNFFRPTVGEIDVDVNDIANLLQIAQKRMEVEGTWLIDAFGNNDSVYPARPSDEVLPSKLCIPYHLIIRRLS